ncbi:hypothetical protein BDV26DRAFT_160996 [Aspergillus bertholletiae]|uniref:Uncharacterized protein n=1 Tax=Aspergillus bertholletiae TaxID=1226010 RepID=A0A5N7BN26_9EURO|nr:hypothetical protein BDV26DRAFT_160996 [Aspergillus bertholletiae]
MVSAEDGLELSQLSNVSVNPGSSMTANSNTNTCIGKKGKGTSVHSPAKQRDSTNYNIGNSVPRQDSPQAIDPRNFTTFRPDQKDWSWTNLPDILYQFEPQNKKDRKSDPPRMSYPIHGRYLRDLPILPDNISSRVEEFRVEAWMRLDRRIRLRDITDRMHPGFRIQDNALQQRSVRFRQQFSLIAWDSGNKRSQHLKQEILRKMEHIGLPVAWNTTRGLTPGLINPALGEYGGIVSLPDQYNKGKRVSRGRKPSKTVQDEAVTEAVHREDIVQERPLSLSTPAEESASIGRVDKSNELSQEGLPLVVPSPTQPVSTDLAVDSRPVETVAGPFNHVPPYIPFDERNDSPKGPLPVITGVIPDNQLPVTVSMADMDLTMGVKNPVPRHNAERTLRPIALERIQRRRLSPLKVVRGGFCGNACRLGKLPTPIFTNLTLVSGPDSADLWREKLLPPSQGLYPDTLTPYSASDLPFGIRDQVIDNLFEQCLSGDRYLFDVPAMIPEDMEIMDLGNIGDIKIDDYDDYFQS